MNPLNVDKSLPVMVHAIPTLKSEKPILSHKNVHVKNPFNCIET